MTEQELWMWMILVPKVVSVEHQMIARCREMRTRAQVAEYQQQQGRGALVLSCFVYWLSKVGKVDEYGTLTLFRFSFVFFQLVRVESKMGTL